MKSPLLMGVNILFLMSLLQGCFPTLVVNPAPILASTLPSTPPSGSSDVQMPSSQETIARILTLPTLTLRVGEEWMLNGDVQMSSLRVLRFDSVASLLVIENLTPDLLAVNPAQRLIKALKTGVAELKIRTPLASGPVINIKVLIEDSPVNSALDPHVALLELEIE